MTQFVTARAAGFEEDEDDEVLEAGFSEGEDGSGLAILFQRTDYEPNENEVELGWDTYSVTTGDGLTCYGGVERVTLTGGSLTIRFAERAATTLRVERDMQVDLDVSETDINDFRAGFTRVVEWGRADQIPELLGLGLLKIENGRDGSLVAENKEP